MKNRTKTSDFTSLLRQFSLHYIVATILALTFGCIGFLFFANNTHLFCVIFLVAYIIVNLVFFFVGQRLVDGVVQSSKTSNEQLAVSAAELQRKLETTSDNYEQLQKALETARPTMLQTALQRVLTASVDTTDELNYLKHLLLLDDDSLSFYVMYGIVYENSVLEASSSETSASDSSWLTNSSANSADWMKAVTEELAEHFSYHGICYSFSPMERHYAIVIPFTGDSDAALIAIQEKAIHLHNQLLETHSIWFFAGLGQPCQFPQLWTTYEQARQMSGYTAKNYIFLPYEMMKKNSQAYYYPSKFSTQLAHFISTGKSDQISELFTLIRKENMEERSISIQLLRFLLTDIRNTILHARFQMENVPADCEESLHKAELLLEEQDLSFRSLETSALLLASICAPKETDSNIMNTIVAYIQDNFQDPSLGLNKISNEFHISESYFSHMFKEFMGSNFSSYLEDLRLTKASQLLQENCFDLNEIATVTGYNSIASFRRAFKKKYGVTPSAMVK